MHQYKHTNIFLGIFLLGSICTAIAQQSPNDAIEINVHFFKTKLMNREPVEGFTTHEIEAFHNAKTLEEARIILNPLIEQNNAEALTTLALIEMAHANTKVGLSYLKKAAEEYHHPRALVNIGNIYAAAANNNHPGALIMAKEYLHIAADECNEPEACALLAELYL